MNTTPSSTPHLTSTTASDRPRSGQDQPRVDATKRARPAGERALVLGGGGSTGNAWLIGVIAGLFDAGLDVTTADLTVGTSAGSTAAAQIAGATPTELLAAILAAAPQQRTGPVGSDRGRIPIRTVADHLERISRIIASAEDAADMRRRMGAAALDMDAASDGSWQTQWRATVAARLPSQRWPQRTVLITAVDAHTGEPVVFDRHSGVDLADAVAASCAVAFPTGSGTADTSTAATDPTPRMPIWQPDTHGCWCCHHSAAEHSRRWTGACISRHRSTNSAHAAAESKRSSRTATPSTCSAPMRWICRCVRPLLEPVTTKAESSPSSSPKSGADAFEISRLGRRDDTCSSAVSCCFGARGRIRTDDLPITSRRAFVQPVPSGSVLAAQVSGVVQPVRSWPAGLQQGE